MLTFLQVALILTIPESPRWLMDKGREEAARKVLVKYHCGGDESDPLAAYEFEEIRNALQIEKETNNGSSFKSLFVGKGNQRRMLVIIAIAFFSQWSGNGLVSYYLTKVLIGIGITNPETQTLINGILNIYNYGTAIFGALMCDRIGRRPLFLISTAGMTVSFCIWTACSAIYQKSAVDVDENDVPLHPNKSAGNAVLAMIFLFYTFYNLALSVMKHPLDEEQQLTQLLLPSGHLSWSHIPWKCKLLVLRNLFALFARISKLILSRFSACLTRFEPRVSS